MSDDAPRLIYLTAHAMDVMHLMPPKLCARLLDMEHRITLSPEQGLLASVAVMRDAIHCLRKARRCGGRPGEYEALEDYRKSATRTILAVFPGVNPALHTFECKSQLVGPADHIRVFATRWGSVHVVKAPGEVKNNHRDWLPPSSPWSWLVCKREWKNGAPYDWSSVSMLSTRSRSTLPTSYRQFVFYHFQSHE